MNRAIARHRAPAKLNLGLEIIGRRPDGYHELVTIFQTIALYDEITVATAAPGELTLTADPTLGGENNLILRAARALAARTGCADGATLALDKGIPVAAGLGGGSSDAATTLRALRDHWDLPTTDAELAALATRLGADVPFFLRGGTALASGIGEALIALPPLRPCWFVTLTPTIALPADKTRRLYAALTPRDFGDGARTLAQAERLRQGLPLDPTLLVNSFATPLERLFPALADWRERLIRAGAPFVLPSGSGPTLYTMVESAGVALAIQETMGIGAARIHVARCVGGQREAPGQ
ncbi:MAG TPA: 4-(cytidine 5'-diphospho)-2-C-methyl-D-erythritol kinase [Thermomicrobiales bacterium]|jgi:4-diphosphocytidyl-2-C-methyl-D-erythritol kinase